MRKLIFFIAFLGLAAPALATQNMTADSTTYSISQTIPYISLIDKTKVPQQNGTMAYCSDCKQTPVCVPNGKGAMATLVNGTWQCGLGIQGSSVAGAGTINQGTIGAYAGYVGPDNYTIGPMPNPLSFYTGPIELTGTQTNGADQINNVSVNGVVNAKTFGAIGDGIYSGDYTHNPDASTTAGGSQVIFPTLVLPNQYVGALIFIQGAGTAGGEYVGTITSLLGTAINVTPVTPTAVTNAYWVIGHDNTATLQAWLNVVRNQSTLGNGFGKGPPTVSGYLPTGVYVHRGLNFGGVQGLTITGAGFDNQAGGGHDGGSMLLCMVPIVNPKNLPANQVGCHDFTGALNYTVRDLRFKNGNVFGGSLNGPESGYWNVLLSRHPTAGFAISNTFENVSFSGWGPYGVVIQNSEQNSWINDTFGDDASTGVQIYISTNLSFQSPFYGAMTGAGQSTTLNRFSGGATQISANGNWGPDTGQCAVVIDSNPGDLTFDGAYIRLNGDRDSFVCDSTNPSVPFSMSFYNLRVEPNDIASTNAYNHFINFTQTGSGWNGGELHNVTWGVPGTQSAPIFNAPNGNISAVHFSNFESNSWPNPLVAIKSGGDDYFGNLNAGWIQINGKVVDPVNATRNAFYGASVANYGTGIDQADFEALSGTTGANDWTQYTSGIGSGAPWGPGGMGWNYSSNITGGAGQSAGGFTSNGTFIDPTGISSGPISSTGNVSGTSLSTAGNIQSTGGTVSAPNVLATGKATWAHSGCPAGSSTPGAIGVYSITGCDAHGLIKYYQDGTGKVTLSFNQPFSSVAVCTLTGVGNNYPWYTSNQTASGIIFYCSTTLGSQTNCPDQIYVAYNCFATGAP